MLLHGEATLAASALPLLLFRAEQVQPNQPYAHDGGI